MKEFFKKAWKWLDGKKTIIGLLAMNVLQTNLVSNAIPHDWHPVAYSLVGLLTGVGFLDKARKAGYTEKVAKAVSGGK